jgi:hypothetical protein
MAFLLLVQLVCRNELLAGIGVLRSGVFGAAIAYEAPLLRRSFAFTEEERNQLEEL